MKMKYILGMTAGLIVMATNSCSDKKTTDTATNASEKETEVTGEGAEVKRETDVSNNNPAAYYITFKGDGS